MKSTVVMNSYTVSPEHAPPDDVAALVELVAVIQQVQRTEDTDGFLALFAADAVWVNGAGSRLVGPATPSPTSPDTCSPARWSTVR